MLELRKARLCAVGFAWAAAMLAPVRAGAEPSDAPSAPIRPRTAEIMPNAAHSLLLDVVDTGAHLVAVGSRGQILLSDDGLQWQQVDVPVRATLTAVDFVDADNGWAVGHDAVILHTGDGGRTWVLQNFQPELEKPFLDVLFLDRMHGFGVGAYGLFEQTTDGGAHWTAVDAPAILEDGLHLYAIRKLGNGDLFIAGEQGLLGLSSDGGKTWARLNAGYDGTFFSAAPMGGAGAVVCGLRGNAYYAADVTQPQWQKLDTGGNESLYDCTPDGPGHVVMAGVNGALRMLDTKTLKVTSIPDSVGTALSAVLPWKQGLIVVGESGVRNIAAAP